MTGDPAATPSPAAQPPRTGWRGLGAPRLSRHAGELLALTAGWAVALAVLLPGIPPAGSGERGAPVLVLGAALAWWVAVVAVIRSDLRSFIIPDGASLAIAGLGLAVAVGGPGLSGQGLTEAAWGGVGALATALVAFMLFVIVGAAFRWLGRDALGFGDVKLAGASATWLAPADAALALEIAALGAIAVLLATRRSAPLRDTAVPFGAFMAPAAWLVFVLGPLLRDGAGPSPW